MNKKIIASVVESIVAAVNWFDNLSEQKKREYVKLHPDSKYARSFKPSNLKAGKSWSAHSRILDPEHHRKHAKHHAIAGYFLKEKLKSVRSKPDRDDILEQISKRKKWEDLHSKMFKKLGGTLVDERHVVKSHMRQFRRNPSKENSGERMAPPMKDAGVSVGDINGQFGLQPNMSIPELQTRASSRLSLARGDEVTDTSGVSLTNGYTHSQKESPFEFGFQKDLDKGQSQLKTPLPINVKTNMELY